MCQKIICNSHLYHRYENYKTSSHLWVQNLIVQELVAHSYLWVVCWNQFVIYAQIFLLAWSKWHNTHKLGTQNALSSNLPFLTKFSQTYVSYNNSDKHEPTYKHAQHNCCQKSSLSIRIRLLAGWPVNQGPVSQYWKKFFPSPQLLDHHWDQPSLLPNGYCGFFSWR
jgi:hypothetical protein